MLWKRRPAGSSMPPSFSTSITKRTPLMASMKVLTYSTQQIHAHHSLSMLDFMLRILSGRMPSQKRETAWSGWGLHINSVTGSATAHYSHTSTPPPK